MRVFLTSIIAQLLLNPYLCWRGYKILPEKKVVRKLFVGLFALELLIYFIGFIFHAVLPDAVMIPIEWICGTWYIASIYLTIALLVLEIFRLKLRTRRIVYPLLLIAVIPLLLVAYHTVKNPVVRNLTVHIDKPCAGHDSLTVVYMSDLHIGEMIGKEMVQKYVAMSNAAHPDFVLIGGDVIDNFSRFATVPHIEEDLRKLEAPLGTYLVLGNHEYRGDFPVKLQWLRQIGGTLLIDSVAQPDSSFYLIGRDDYTHKSRCSLQHLSSSLDKSKPIILLDHEPWDLQEVADNGADLALFGHTHNGQIWPHSLLLKFVFECPYGYCRKGNSQIYVSSGIGIAGLPYRVLTRSEMVVLHLYFRNKD